MIANDQRSSKTRYTTAAAATLVALLLILTGCQRELGGRSLQLVNEARGRHGLPALSWDDQAAEKAQKWAEHLANKGSLEHSTLSDGMSGWNTLGENVGYHSNVDNVHQLFLNSPRHRATMLSGAYNAVGIGVVVRDGRYYIVQVYRG
ncbi:MAG: hypothetical protein GX868_00780 [Actinobacteria bacterium]|nr:hypothetical protein [Actinomycetota bacterium]